MLLTYLTDSPSPVCTLIVVLGRDDLAHLESGRPIRLRLRDFGVAPPLGDRHLVIVRDGPEMAKWREGRMAPPEIARVECLMPETLRLLAAGGHQMTPAGRNGLETLLVGQGGVDGHDDLACVRRALVACGRRWPDGWPEQVGVAKPAMVTSV